jgi:multiple sugar transport system ATP-binding protein
MASVRLENVSRTFPGGVRAVDRVNLEVHDREFVVIVGPSGCGKSTTLRMIAGLEEATGGTIRIGDRVVNYVAPKDRDVAMVFQNYALYPHMSVYRNLAFALELRQGVSRWRQAAFRLISPGRAARLAQARYDIATRVHDAARILGIEQLLDRQPRQLSGGERQRVALGRAMVREPAVFLFDEPLSNLDAKLRVEMRRELKQLHQRLAATMIYVTHDQVEALTLGQRVVVMDRGTIQQVGPPQELYRNPRNQFVASFLGSPGMNFVPAQFAPGPHGNAAVLLQGTAQTLPWPKKVTAAPGSKLLLGIRPEHVRLSTTAEPASLPAAVQLVESLGDVAVITLVLTHARQATAELPPLVSKISGDRGIRAGDAIQVALDLDQAHLFDPATGENRTNSGH